MEIIIGTFTLDWFLIPFETDSKFQFSLGEFAWRFVFHFFDAHVNGLYSELCALFFTALTWEYLQFPVGKAGRLTRNGCKRKRQFPAVCLTTSELLVFEGRWSLGPWGDEVHPGGESPWHWQLSIGQLESDYFISLIALSFFPQGGTCPRFSFCHPMHSVNTRLGRRDDVNVTISQIFISRKFMHAYEIDMQPRIRHEDSCDLKLIVSRTWFV